MKNKIISIILSTAMLCPTSFAISNTNNKNESKNESKATSYVKRNSIKTAVCTVGSLAFVTLSSYLIHKYVNSKKIDQEKQIEHEELIPEELIPEQLIPEQLILAAPGIEIRNVPVVKASKRNKLLRKKNVFGFFAYTLQGRSSMMPVVQMFDDSAAYYNESLGQNNNNNLIIICKKVYDSIYEGKIDERPLPPFVLVDGNFETIGNNDNCKYKYWCEFKKDFKGNEKTEDEIKDQLPKDVEKICDFDHKIKDKTAKFSLYREIVHEDPIDSIEFKNKIPVISKLERDGIKDYPISAIKKGFVPKANKKNSEYGLCLKLLNH